MKSISSLSTHAFNKFILLSFLVINMSTTNNKNKINLLVKG